MMKFNLALPFKRDFNKKTKIVATLGPATSSEEIIKKRLTNLTERQLLNSKFPKLPR